MNLTRRQREIYKYLVDYAGHVDHPPTRDELCEALGLASNVDVVEAEGSRKVCGVIHIHDLVKAGLR